MRTSFVVVAANGTKLSPTFNVFPLREFNYNISFEFYNDAALTIPSTSMTGTITLNGKPSANSVWMNLPITATPSTIDISNAKSLTVYGVIYQLQLITASVTNTNYINVIVDTSATN